MTSALAVAAAALASGAWLQPASAMTPFTGGQDVVVAYSDDDEWIGHGDQHLFRGSGSSIELGSSSEHVVVQVFDLDSELRSLEFYLSAPAGQTLTTGVYANAGSPWRTGNAGRPGIDIASQARACNDNSGTFEVRDIARDDAGRVTRLWVVYEQFCSARAARALWGEIRLGMAPTADGTLLVPSIVRWPSVDLGTPRTTVPVTLLAGETAVDVREVAVDGAQANDIALPPAPRDQCAGTTVPAGGSCRTRVAFAPSAPGLRQARLDVTDAHGTVRTAQLQGWSYGGTTGLRLAGAPGEWLTDGREHVAGAADAGFEISADRTGVGARLMRDRRSAAFTVGLSVPWADQLVIGKPYLDARNPSHGGLGHQIRVGRGSLECPERSGAFVVDRARRQPDGALRSIALRFEQRCEDGAPLARGVLLWRDGDETVPAPWMTSSTAISPVPAPTAPAPPASSIDLPDPWAVGNWITPPGPTVPPTPLPDHDGPGPEPTPDPSEAPDRILGSGIPVIPAPGLTRSAAVAPRVAFRGLRPGNRTARFAVRVPAAGTLTVTPTAKLYRPNGRARTIRLGMTRISVSRAGTRTVSVRVSRAASRALSTHRGRVRLTVATTWRPRTGDVVRGSTTETLRRG